LGLGCFGKLLQFSSYGACNDGCGEVYWHDWINEPPCPDPCDASGNWTDVAATSCAREGPGLFSRPYLQPACGGPNFRRPGRLLFSSWTGLAGIGHHLRRGLLPPYNCSTCGDETCDSCTFGKVSYDAMAQAVCSGCGDPNCTVVSDSSFPINEVTQEFDRRYIRPPHPVLAERLRSP